jgi:hypothetical protein
MARFDNDTYRSLNESIAHVQNPQAALNEALEYAAALEAALLSLCEELEIDPQDLMEDIQTPARERELNNQIRRTRRKYDKGRGSVSVHSLLNLDDKRAREKYQTPTTLYGKGGKVLATRKRTTKYTKWKPTKRK